MAPLYGDWSPTRPGTLRSHRSDPAAVASRSSPVVSLVD
ncbi:hypothetical protein FM110_11385 [Brachybacterium nesterenkovii]|uniref:Uncharacterized protein n=1 Tax=Brachybacterium nesterenkovii TaxID=47847 RepID=A0A1X6X5W6_9MICO|nr:hypothetical protein FM110_11385 [Brachybacterium nesterenkovii]